ncbi:MAG: hypothetical protein Alpg2KO_15740 [Alphaproteobacteria bacterium]
MNLLPLKKTAQHKNGVSLLSYGLVVGLISVVALTTVTSVGSSTDGLFTDVSTTLDDVITGGSAGAESAAASPTPDIACSAVSQSFNTAGASLQTVPVPAGCEIAEVKLWGAGGGSYGFNCTGCEAGGPGGFTSATIPVTPGSNIFVAVGIAGARTNSGSAGGWPGGGTGSGNGGGGGGLSGIFSANAVTQGNALAIAGGGGSSAVVNGAVGYGGGTTGGTGSDSSNTAGGDQTGAGGQLPIDGEDSTGGGGGGGGYFGGLSRDTNVNGGGGSGFINTSAGVTGSTTGVSTGTFSNESSQLPPSNSDPDYVSPRGRSASDGDSGGLNAGDGLVVIIWQDG